MSSAMILILPILVDTAGKENWQCPAITIKLRSEGAVFD